MLYKTKSQNYSAIKKKLHNRKMSIKFRINLMDKNIIPNLSNSLGLETQNTLHGSHNDGFSGSNLPNSATSADLINFCRATTRTLR